MAEDKKAQDVAMELAEDARESKWEYRSFTAEMFRGNFGWDLMHPFPAQSAEDKAIGDALLEKVKEVLETYVDPYEIDRSGEYSREALDKLAELGLFGMKIPKEYGGLGLSVQNYARVLGMVGSYCGSTVTYLSAHQSIGVPEPLKSFGTEEQKKKFLPRLAKGEISAFALTEPDVGSDPAKMITWAEPSEDGSYYILNGDKLWCTNGMDPKTSLIVVMARTPDKISKSGKPIPQISAFVVEMDSPGVERARRCMFMGLRGIMNGALTFKDVKVPVENMIGKPGMGLKIALTTLNTGRLGLPAAGIGTLKMFIKELEQWSNSRVQWGKSVGKHQSISKKIAIYASHLFAMQAMVSLTCAFADQKNADIRLEASAAKYFCSEYVWKCLDDYMQIRGGRGYENPLSLYGRGEKPSAAEIAMRDMRIGRIFEGSSEVMHLIMAREAVDTHFSLVMPIMKPKPGQKESRIALAWKAFKFYSKWYPSTYMPASTNFNVNKLSGANRAHLGYVSKSCKKLARRIFHTMGRYQQKLENEQVLLGNFVDIGTDLFVMAAALAYAEHLLSVNPGDQTPQELVDLFCSEARRRIEANFKAVNHHHNKKYVKVANLLMDGKLQWLAKDAITDVPPKYRDYAKNDYEHPETKLTEKK
ncbi:MAG TPA: acyl-CoA dehydrogenase family protein [Candidatus Hydrogenedentes bacterium]|jgi:alkylation response protein AidB-like acyl-CoA dehydrogenase|nr:acyl-CoA dehydrogenase family protein [Candidatus Hydrogenedentota bacterium]